MYIIIHKYQRWVVNIETKQKYLKNKSEHKQKQIPNIFKYGSWAKNKLLTSNQLDFSERIPSLDKLSTTIYTSCSVVGREKKGGFHVFAHLHICMIGLFTLHRSPVGLRGHRNVLNKISQVKIRYKARHHCTVQVKMKVSGGFGVKIMDISRKGFCFEKRR